MLTQIISIPFHLVLKRLGIVILLLFGCNIPEMPESPLENAKQTMTIQALPGSLDQIPLLNSNDPESIKTGGILVSSFPKDLNYLFQDKFGIFAHHIAQTPLFSSQKLQLGLLAFNPGQTHASLELEQGLAFLTHPDAPFIELPPLSTEAIYAGPGDRLVTEWLAGKNNISLQNSQVLPGEYTLLYTTQVPTNPLFFFPQANAHSLLLHLQSTQPLYLAYIALYQDRPAQLEDYLAALSQGQRAGPRDLQPTHYQPEESPPP